MPALIGEDVVIACRQEDPQAEPRLGIAQDRLRGRARRPLPVIGVIARHHDVADAAPGNILQRMEKSRFALVEEARGAHGVGERPHAQSFGRIGQAVIGSDIMDMRIREDGETDGIC